MRSGFVGLLFVGLAIISSGGGVLAQTLEDETGPHIQGPGESPEKFYIGQVTGVLTEDLREIGLPTGPVVAQKVKIRFISGERAGEEIEVDYSVMREAQKLVVGHKVIVVNVNNTTYIFDRYRLPALAGILSIFVLLVILFVRWRGLAALIGLVISILILALIVVPQIMAGRNPVLISFLGAGLIALLSVYCAHGFNRRTSVALASMLITLVIAISLAWIFVALARLVGLGSEEAFYLQTVPGARINLQGLLLGGIIIGALGVLDDITTSQAAAVEEIWRANPKLTNQELRSRAGVVGREHITSLVNTLALAYVGASLPSLLLFTIYRRPWWVVANTETIAEEIVRTLVGSIALMLAVPITTWLAVIFLPRDKKDDKLPA